MVELELENWQKVIDTSLTAHFGAAARRQRRMIARSSGGKIIVISAQHTPAAAADCCPLHGSKGGIKMLTCSMAATNGRFNIQTNAIGRLHSRPT